MSKDSKNANVSTTSIISAALAQQESNSASVTQWLPIPDDPKYVYPVSSFPPPSTFEISIEYPAIIAPARQTSELRKKLKDVLLCRPKLKVVYPLDDLDPIPAKQVDNGKGKKEDNADDSKASKAEDDPIMIRRKLRKLILLDRPDIFESSEELQNLLKSETCCKGTHTVCVSYPDWTVDEVLRRILPVKEVPSAFEMVGHLAHINLRDELLPYKYIIGKVFLDKNTPRIKTIVNKVGTIETEYRTFGMEVIAGDDREGWSQVTVREEGCQYTMDFRKVYWNSRLGGEHRRLVDVIAKDAKKNFNAETNPLVVADLMGGIGPFAVPLSSKGYGIHVHANDLNPDSYKYLSINKKKNKCENLTCYNMDASAFCHQLQDKGIDFHHVLMNLPATAPEFLDAFRGFTGKTLPRIHVHCFGPKGTEDAEKDTIERCSKALGASLDKEKDEVSVHTVRDVAPKKNMYCVSFTLPNAARELNRIEIKKVENATEGDEDEPESKRAKLNE